MGSKEGILRILLVAYDNDSYIHYFPLGLAYVASKLESEGHEVNIYRQDMYHLPESHLAQKLKAKSYDVVGVGMCAGYYQYAKLLKIAEVVRDSDAELWLGGHLVTPDRSYFKEKTGATYICEGEYDYSENVDDIAYPAWDLFDIDYYSLMRHPCAENRDRCFPVLSGRGCPFRCNFCYRMVEGYRPRSIASIKEEVEILTKDYHINYIIFADELLMVNAERPIEIAEMLKPFGIKWKCDGRLNFAKPKILKAMKDSGCVFINYGIESVDDQVLANMNKKLNYNQIVKGIEATLEAGISPGLNIIWGNIGDTLDSLWRGVDFLAKYDNHAQLRTIRPVTPYPGCDLYYYAIEEGLLSGIDDFYQKHINSDLASVQFTNLSDEDFHSHLREANSILINRYLKEKGREYYRDLLALYKDRNTTFRGFRQS